MKTVCSKLTCMSFAAVLAASFAILMIAAGSSPARAQGEQVVIVPGAIGGTGFQFVTGMANAASRDLRKLKAQVSIAASGGFADNAVRVYRGIAKIGAISESDLFDIVKHEGKFKRPIKDGTILFPLYQFNWHMVVKRDSPIKTLRDLDGKVISIQPKGASTRVLSVKIFDALGLKYDGKGLVHSDSADALLAGSIDALASGGANPVHMAMAAKRPMRVLGFTEDEAKVTLAKLPWLTRFPNYDFAPYYAGTGKVLLLTMWVHMTATTELSDEVAEALVRRVYSDAGMKKMQQATALARMMKKDDILTTPLPVHPGAVKAYKAIGVDIPADRVAKR